jgi:hypothetical protein
MVGVSALRPVAEVPTEELIATIREDRDDVATFEARRTYQDRTRSGWRDWAPTVPRAMVHDTDTGVPIHWHSFHETGLL